MKPKNNTYMKNDITTSQALNILKEYNDWRRGKETEMLNPKTIGKAIDKAIEVLTKQQNDNNELITKLNKLIKNSEEKEKIFEEHNMVSSELTSNAMAFAYKYVKKLIIDKY